MAEVSGTTKAQWLFGRFELARIQLTKAETTFSSAKERARIAKRKRKEAKTAVRLAKKAVKRAKEELSEAREAVAIAEAKLAQAGKRRFRTQAKTPSVKQMRLAERRVRVAKGTHKRRPFRRRASVLARGEKISPNAMPTQPVNSTQALATSQSMGDSPVETEESPEL